VRRSINIENVATKRWKTGISLAQLRQWVKIDNQAVGLAEFFQETREGLSVSQSIALLDPAAFAGRHDETAPKIIFNTGLRDVIHQHERRIPGRHINRKLLELIPPALPQDRIRIHRPREDHDVVLLEAINPIAVILCSPSRSRRLGELPGCGKDEAWHWRGSADLQIQRVKHMISLVFPCTKWKLIQ
jgi:hypothetical protein